MRIDIPQDLPPRRRETPPQTIVPRPYEPTSVQQHLQSLKQRAAQNRPNGTHPRRPPTRSPRRGPEDGARPRAPRDPRESIDPRRPQRNQLPSQTVGLQLRPEERKLILELGCFRVIQTSDLAKAIYDGKQRKLDEDLRFLRSKGLIQTRYVNLRRDGSRHEINRIEVATLTRDGRAWLRKSGEVPQGQTVYYGFVKPREIEHDSLIYRAYRDAAKRIERDGGSNLRVKIDFEIKSDVQKDIYRARKSDPKRDIAAIKQEVAAKHALPLVNGGIQIPDARIEFDLKVDETPNREPDQRSRTGSHEDIEVLTAAYRRGHLRAKAQTGFRAYVSSADRSTVTSKIEDDHNMMRDIFDL